MLNEVSRRRPDFRPGPSIRLADGWDWTIPAPPRVTAPEAEGFGPDYAATVAALESAEDRTERLRAELALAIYLLSRNYDLTPDDLYALLGFPPDDPALAAMQAAFHRIAREHLRSCRPADADGAPRGDLGHLLTAALHPDDHGKWVGSRDIASNPGRMTTWFRALLSRFVGRPTSSMRG
jgi:hypothetical protein